jgi:hypothetical protein
MTSQPRAARLHGCRRKYGNEDTGRYARRILNRVEGFGRRWPVDLGGVFGMFLKLIRLTSMQNLTADVGLARGVLAMTFGQLCGLSSLQNLFLLRAH